MHGAIILISDNNSITNKVLNIVHSQHVSVPYLAIRSTV